MKRFSKTAAELISNVKHLDCEVSDKQHDELVKFVNDKGLQGHSRVDFRRSVAMKTYSE